MATQMRFKHKWNKKKHKCEEKSQHMLHKQDQKIIQKTEDLRILFLFTGEK